MEWGLTRFAAREGCPGAESNHGQFQVRYCDLGQGGEPSVNQRTSFASETNASSRDKRDQSQTKMQQDQRN
jgi:hypothetical protein